MKPLRDEIAEAIKQARFDSINTERDPFDHMAQAAIDVVERRLLSHETKIFVAKEVRQTIGKCANTVIADTSVHAAWQAVKEG